MDCSTEYPNSGCTGGAISTALNYIVTNGGLNGEDDYPFTQADNEEVVFSCDTVRQERYVWLGEPEQDARDEADRRGAERCGGVQIAPTGAARLRECLRALRCLPRATSRR